MKNYEKKLLEQIDAEIADNIDNPDFQIQDILDKVEISHATLHRKLIKWTGSNPNNYINNQRLEKAKKLLEVGVYPTIKETAQAVGFRRAGYFSKLFFETFQIMPNEFLKH